MPPRRRRAGYQPDQLSAQVQEAIAAEAARLEDLAKEGGERGDLETIRATSEVFNALEDAILAIGEPRLRAIARLRTKGWSYTKLVETTGLSKTRVGQLVTEARTRGLR